MFKLVPAYAVLQKTNTKTFQIIPVSHWYSVQWGQYREVVLAVVSFRYPLLSLTICSDFCVICAVSKVSVSLCNTMGGWKSITCQ